MHLFEMRDKLFYKSYVFGGEILEKLVPSYFLLQTPDGIKTWTRV